MRSPDCHRDGQSNEAKGAEWGFTLPELLVTIAIIGIVAAIAIPSFFGVMEARRVESAANQLASDLRLAHGRATNQVGTSWVVSANADSSAYKINTEQRTLPSGTKVNAAFTVTFKSDGTAVSPPATIRVSATGGGSSRDITISPTTSNVKVTP